MESEKVKEIKQALECCSQGKCEKCLIGKKNIRKCVDILLKYTLTLINELERESDEQYKRIMELEQDLVHADENVFYRECNVTLRENKIKEQALNKFAERLKKQIKAKVDYYNDEVFDYSYNGISEKEIDEILKEFLK